MTIFRKLFLFFFSIIFLFLSVNAFYVYEGSKTIYLLYSFTTFIFFIYLTDGSSTFFENFLSFYFLLGYWFSLVIKRIFFKSNYKDYSDGFADFDFTPNSYDEVLMVIIISFFAVIFSSFIRRKFFFKKIINKNYIKNFDYLNINKITILLFVLSVIIFFINYYYKIYQRGFEMDNNLSFLISNFFKWIIIMGLLSFYALFIYLSLNRNIFPRVLIILSIFTEFIISISMLSRGMIFNSSAILWGLYKSKLGKKNLLFILVSLILVLFLFIANIQVVEKLRLDNVLKYNPKINKTNFINTDNKVDKVSPITTIVSRLHGFEAIMAVQSLKNKGKVLLFKALSEKKSENGISFFDNLKKENRKRTNILTSISLPGLIAFLYYSGSLIFIFTSLFFLVLIFNYSEKIILHLTSQNFILTSLFSQIIAYRLWHFGYLPMNSYKLFSTIFLNAILIYIIINFVLNKLNNFLSKKDQ